jgi:hypothetical protein
VGHPAGGSDRDKVSSTSSKTPNTVGAGTTSTIHLAAAPGSGEEKALRFLFDSREEITLQNLRIPPFLSAHHNTLHEESFFLPKDRFGGTEDVALAPLIRNVVDQALRDYARADLDILRCIGQTPISPYGSMGLSVSRWGSIDWDFIRDLDWRIFLPPQISHNTGFKTDLQQNLSAALRSYGLHTLLFGKDEWERPQEQLRERNGNVHGFHFFLLAMEPGFVKRDLHQEGGYSPHFTYFPEDSMNSHLEMAVMEWPDWLERQRENYTELFNRVGFHLYGEDRGESGRHKVAGWYLRKALKWYADLARVRGLWDLEQDLLYQYEHFQGTERELQYLARRRYYVRLEPVPSRMSELDRDLIRTASLVYAQARAPNDPLVGQRTGSETLALTVLEPVPNEFIVPACELLRLKGLSFSNQVRFADNLPRPSRIRLRNSSEGDGGEAVAIPSGWSMVFNAAYVCHVMRKAVEAGQAFSQNDAHQALARALAVLLDQIS